MEATTKEKSCHKRRNERKTLILCHSLYREREQDGKNDYYVVYFILSPEFEILNYLKLN